MKTHNFCMFMLTALFCGALFCVPANAKVCFVGDEECGAGGSFEADYVDKSEDLCASIKDENGNLVYQKGACPAGTQVTGYCPYNSAYVQCCGMEYVYDSCVYPHKVNGKCGNKFSCVCDPEVYKYDDSTCAASFSYSNAGGTACTQIEAGTNATVKKILYSACLCDRGLYPYGENDCEQNSDVNGDPCMDSTGKSFWNSCKCDRSKYTKEAYECEFGGDGEGCVQGGYYYYEKCCSCANYPAGGDSERPSDPYATKFDKCGCPRGDRYKITQCSEGYRPDSTGSECVPIQCTDAVKLFFAKNPNTSYAVFTGNKLVTYKKLTDAEKEKLPEYQRSYAVGEAVESTTATRGVVLSSVTASAGSYGMGFGGTKAFELYSPEYFSQNGYSSDYVMLQRSCQGQTPPTVYAPSNSSTSFPTYSSNKTFSMYGLRLYLYSNDVYGYMNFYNTDVDGSGSFRQKVVLRKVSGRANSEPVFGMYNSEFAYGLNADGYNFDISYMYIRSPYYYSQNEASKFVFRGGEVFQGGTVHFYPDFGTSGVNHYYEREYHSYLNFVGPTGGTPANVYTNIRVGYEGSGYDGKADYSGKSSNFGQAAPGMEVRISGNLVWNMYDDRGVKYWIGTTPASRLYSTDYGSGNYAKIKYSSNGQWKWCKGLTEMLFHKHGKSAALCTGSCKFYNNTKPYTDGYYWFSVIDKDKKQKLEYTIRYETGGESRCPACWVHTQAVNMDEGYVYVIGGEDVRRYFSDCGTD